MRNEIATLITEYATGTTVAKSTLDVFCEMKSVNRNEFYQGYTAGLYPKLVMDISPVDYDSAKVTGNDVTYPNKVKYAGETYLVIRTFRKNLMHMEITLG